jgi:hypothetical protein
VRVVGLRGRSGRAHAADGACALARRRHFPPWAMPSRAR